MTDLRKVLEALPDPGQTYSLAELSREFALPKLEKLYRKGKPQPYHMRGVPLASSFTPAHTASLYFHKHETEDRKKGFSLTIEFGKAFFPRYHLSINYSETATGFFRQENTSSCLDGTGEPVFPHVTNERAINAVARKIRDLHLN